MSPPPTPPVSTTALPPSCCASGEAVTKYGLKPMAKLVSWGQGGVDPKVMGVGPVVASRQAMDKAGLTIDDMDLIEANEAFAAQSIAVARELKFDMNKVNVNGGAISIGHPVGASGARIIVTLLHEMQKRPEAKTRPGHTLHRRRHGRRHHLREVLSRSV